ncbi:MAG: ATP synthase F1 subunit gamma [Bdellovibrionales bacterium]
MAGLADLRKRIESVKNTQKITKAMKMVSAAKLRKAQERITNLRPYAQGLLTVIADISATQRVSHPLLSPKPNPKNLLLVVVTSDRGLCGSFNAAVIKYADKFIKEKRSEYDTFDLIFVGKRGADYFKRRNILGKETILNLARELNFAMCSDIADQIKNQYASGEYDEVQVIYNEFKSAIQQDVVSESILPVDLSKSEIDAEESSFAQDLIFEPAPEEMIEELLDRHFASQIYRVMSESVASEHGARMSAMENSTKNAGELIQSMTLTYNKLRQEAITTELVEIISGAESV